MKTDNELEKHVHTLNKLLREHAVLGNVQYHKRFSDLRYQGYWYYNSASHGFLGKTFEEALDALWVLIESVQSVQKTGISNKRTSWYEKIKSLF